MLDVSGRELKPAGGRGTERCSAEKPPRDGAVFTCGIRACCAPPFIGGRGTLRSTWGLALRPICEFPTAGRCMLLAGALDPPRIAGDGTAPDALSGP